MLYRYAYDPARHQWRWQIIAAVDNNREWKKLFNEATAELEHRRAASEKVDRSEQIMGAELEPGTGAGRKTVG